MGQAAQTLTRASLAGGDETARPRSMWRYSELLPLRDPAGRVSLDEGWTPLVELPRLAASLGIGRLLLKDEGANPGGTFKARGACCTVSRSPELGASHLAISTNGKAGEALATYCARAGLRVPKSYGDRLVLQAIYASNGLATSVSDEEMREGLQEMLRLEGQLLCPEDGGLPVALRRLLSDGKITPDDEVVLFGSGNGLKYSDALPQTAPLQVISAEKIRDLPKR